MNTLTLKDGTKIPVYGFDTELVIPVESKAEFESLKSQIRTSNLDKLDGEDISGRIVSGSFLAEGDANYLSAHFGLTKRTELDQRITDLEDAFADITGGAE